jgi:hypothetical protein
VSPIVREAHFGDIDRMAVNQADQPFPPMVVGFKLLMSPNGLEKVTPQGALPREAWGVLLPVV